MDGDDRRGDSPEEPLAADELFGILGNETRMRILQTLWETFDFQDYVVRQQEPLSFSTLLERTGVDDSGNFNYHLGKLGGTLLENREDGYVLTPLGYDLMRAITTYTAHEYRTIDPRVLDDPCPFCGGSLEAKYEREFVHVRCTACDGLADGNINYVHCPATDVKGLGLRTMLDAATLQLMDRVRVSGFGFCGQCHSRTGTTVTVCEDHSTDAGGTCGDCRSRFGATVVVDCRHCGSGGQGPLAEYALAAPSVVALFDGHGSGPRDVGPWRYRLSGLAAVEETLRGSDVPGAVYAFSVGDDRHRVVVEESEGGVDVRPADDA